ncbi:MAG TPA: 2-oxo acid dehydrogenase subunit E2 [Chloroflexi bacterium]|nr:2-oxo acid dehydrogenase subunit E2 [Chloroflexota bacterium]
MATEVIMPRLGESVVEGTIGRWLKQEGEPIEEFEGLLEVESDKVDTEIPAPASGVLLKIYVPAGETVQAGTLLAVIGEPGEEVPEAPVSEPATAHVPSPGGGETAPTPVAAPPRREAPSPPERGGNGAPRISPVVARIAAEHGIDVSRVPGTGRGGRVTKKDILAYIERQATEEAPAAGAEELPPWEQPRSGDLFKPTDDLHRPAPATAAPPDHTHGPPPAPGQPGEIVPLSKMRRLIAEHMVQSKLRTAPHVTTVFEADMSAVVAHRQAHLEDFARRGINLTFTAYFIAAVAKALREHPMVNSQWMDEGILLHREVNIGMAVAVDEGLIVPVVRQADELSLAGLARRINDLAARARVGQLQPDEIKGGTFTITNHGVSGSLFATPIINQPQTAILGVGAIKKRVVVTGDDAIAIRPMVYLTLTFDHRVLDGAAADWFMADVVKRLEGWG